MSRWLVSGLLLLAAGCVGSGATERDEAPALELGPSDNEPMLLRGGSITGPSTSLRVAEDGVRGRYFNEPLFLEWTDQELSGTVAGMPTEVRFLAEGEATLIQGGFAGVAVDLRLDGPWLSGRFGRCNYETERTSEGFVGRRSCEGKEDREPIRVHFPPVLAQRPAREERGLLVLAFANDSSWNHKTMRPPEGTRSSPTGQTPYVPPRCNVPCR